MKIQGKVATIYPLTTGTSAKGNAWSKLTFTLDYVEGEKSYTAAFEVFGDEKIEKCNTIQSGTDVVVDFHIESREWNGRLFTNLMADDIQSLAPAAPKQRATPQNPVVNQPRQQVQPQQNYGTQFDDNSSLPF